MKNILPLYEKRWVNLILNNLWQYVICVSLLLITSGCARAPIPTPEARKQSATALAQSAGWQLSTINTSYFVLAAYLPKTIEKNKTLTVYIEGDGFAWQTSSIPSNNPTPRNPLALQLALKHPFQYGAAAYLARPCQFVSGMQWKTCSQHDWTNGRFSSKAVVSTNEAIDEIKQRFGAEELILVGYSGGGAIATLVAARRTDVSRLVTVAGTLDTAFWTKQNKFKPLAGSLNPADQWSTLVSVPQLHFSGEDDKTVRTAVAQSYADHFPSGARPTIRVIDHFDHECCWAQEWPTLFK